MCLVGIRRAITIQHNFGCRASPALAATYTVCLYQASNSVVLIRIRRHTGSLCSPRNLKQTIDTDPSLPTDTEKRSARWKYVG